LRLGVVTTRRTSFSSSLFSNSCFFPRHVDDVPGPHLARFHFAGCVLDPRRADSALDEGDVILIMDVQRDFVATTICSSRFSSRWRPGSAALAFLKRTARGRGPETPEDAAIMQYGRCPTKRLAFRVEAKCNSPIVDFVMKRKKVTQY
jgi:hypothetical protein